MKRIWSCRRSMLALIGMCLLTAMGCYLKTDVSGALATIILAVAASNAAQAVGEKMTTKKD